MRKLKTFLLAALAITVIACSSDYVYEHDTPDIPDDPPTETVSFTDDELLVLMQMRNPDNRICIDEATEIAFDALDFFGGEISTRSGQARTIADITALRGEPAARVATRSADGNSVEVQMPDTVAFVFNFADDAGFTIVAADTRITSPVLAFVEDGNLDLSEEIDHPGLAVFFAGMEEYIEYSIVEAELRRDSLMDGIFAKIKDMGVSDGVNIDSKETRQSTTSRGYITGPGGQIIGIVQTTRTPGPWSTAFVRGPLLPVEWGQWFPFNDLVRNRSCSRNNLFNGPCSNPREIPVGCVATATAQIMAFWRHPAQLDGRPINWNLLRRFTGRPYAYENVWHTLTTPRNWNEATRTPEHTAFVHEVARLMERIGAGVNMSYGCRNHGGSGAETRDAVTFLRRHGYVGGNIQAFNTQEVISSINSGSPVLARGNHTRNSFIITWYRDGHAWVIDGHLRRSRQITVTTTTTWFGDPPEEADPLPPRSTRSIPTITVTTHTVTETAQFLHNNWGWDTNDDNQNWNGYYVAGSFQVRDRRYGSGMRSVNENPNFQHNREIFPNIRR